MKILRDYYLAVLFSGVLMFQLNAQATFDYTVSVQPKTISGLGGLHSYAFGEHNGKWVFIGGRKDGIHARQPFNAFPENQNNTTIYIVDPASSEVWTEEITDLNSALKEQLQSTNMQFYQDGSILYFIGGYAYSDTDEDHKTFPNLTAIDLEGLINDVVAENDIANNFEQIEDEIFAVTGGNLAKIDDTFYLVGGHRFDGRYNPMDHPTFVQAYTNQVRKFEITNDGGLAYTNYETITDEVNLHRRDYNLGPQIFPDGAFGYTIFSGVFQINQDLPFLYPVNIRSNGVEPIFNFNQLLSHYHSAHVGLYDSLENNMHNLFFGGISQYYYDNENNLIQDDDVPFVKTISRVSRDQNGELSEVLFDQKMPGYIGAGAEFIVNKSLALMDGGIIKMDDLQSDSILIGHLFGGIESQALNPFAYNNPSATSASSTLFEIYLVKETSTASKDVSTYHNFDIEVFPNPAKAGVFKIKMQLPESGDVEIMLTNVSGQVVMNQAIEGFTPNENQIEIQMNEGEVGAFMVTVILNGKYFASEKIIISE